MVDNFSFTCHVYHHLPMVERFEYLDDAESYTVWAQMILVGSPKESQTKCSSKSLISEQQQLDLYVGQNGVTRTPQRHQALGLVGLIDDGDQVPNQWTRPGSARCNVGPPSCWPTTKYHKGAVHCGTRT